MKKMIFILFALSIFSIFGVVNADQVTFAWENADAVAPDGYRLFIRPQIGTYDYSSPVWDGTETTATVEINTGNYAVVARAYVGGEESADSNEVIFEVTPQPDPVIIPGRPRQLTIHFE